MVKSLPYPVGFLQDTCLFRASYILIPAFTRKKGSNFGPNLTPLVKWQISAPLLAGREPVGNQSGNQSGTSADLRNSRLVPDWFPTGSRPVPGWFPICENRCRFEKFWCQIFNDLGRQKIYCFGLKTG